jgi:hypothetical protein
MARKTTPEVKEEQKIQTKYDRKMAARKAKEEKDKRDDKIFKITSSCIGIALVLVIVASIGYSVYSRQNALKGTYIEIGDRKVSQLEFDYYYNNTVNNYLTSYSSILPYMGLDTSRDFADQPYTDDLTWKDMFDEMTVGQITQIHALLEDAEEKGFVHDTTAEYEEGIASIEDAAKTAGASASDYYKSMFGKYASKSNVSPFMKDSLFASAYYSSMLEENKPSEEEVEAYYQENKQNYDKVDYRSFVFRSDLAEDASEEDIEKAMKELKEKADAFVSAREDGTEFKELCIQNASEEEKANYKSEDSDASLSEGYNYSSVPYAISEWLYDDARAEGDLAAVEDETGHQYYVVEFGRKYYDEADDESISSLLSSNKTSEYVASLEEKYEVSDPKGNLKYLTVDTATDTDGEEALEDASNEAEGSGEDPAEDEAQADTAEE